jgi:hypothetical protein
VVGWTDLGTPAGVMLLAHVIRTRLDYVGRVCTGIDNAPSGAAVLDTDRAFHQVGLLEVRDLAVPDLEVD